MLRVARTQVSSAVLLRGRMLSHGGRQLIAQDSGCHSKARCSSEVRARLLRGRGPARMACRVAGKEREELLLEARVQRELRAVPAVPAALCSGPRRTVSCCCRSPHCIRMALVPPSHCTPCSPRLLAARLPALAGRTRQPLRAAVDTATLNAEELLAADDLVTLHPVRAIATFKIALHHP
jgi:hypothetical protein